MKCFSKLLGLFRKEPDFQVGLINLMSQIKKDSQCDVSKKIYKKLQDALTLWKFKKR